MKDEYFLRVLNNHPDFRNLLFQKHHTRLLIRSRLEMIDLETEKEDHARMKKRLRDTEELLIKNKLCDRNRRMVFKAMELQTSRISSCGSVKRTDTAACNEEVGGQFSSDFGSAYTQFCGLP